MMPDAGEISAHFSTYSCLGAWESSTSLTSAPRGQQKRKSYPTDILYQSGNEGLKNPETTIVATHPTPPAPEADGISLLNPGQLLNCQPEVLVDKAADELGISRETAKGVTKTASKMMKTADQMGLGTGISSISNLWSNSFDMGLEITGSHVFMDVSRGAEILDRSKSSLDILGRGVGLGSGTLDIISGGIGLIGAGRELLGATSAPERLAALSRGGAAAAQGIGGGITTWVGGIPTLEGAPVSIASGTLSIAGKAVTWGGVAIAADGIVVMGEGIYDMIGAYREKSDAGFISTEKGRIGSIKTTAGALIVAGGCTGDPVLIAAGGALYIGVKGWENRDEIVAVAVVAKDMVGEGIHIAGKFAVDEAESLASDVARRAQAVKNDAFRIIGWQPGRTAP